MTTIACPRSDSISATVPSRDECVDERGYSIDTGEKTLRIRWVLTHVQPITTMSEAVTGGDDWIEKVLPLLRRIAEMPSNWDAEGSPRPDPEIVRAATRLLNRLRDSDLGAIPVPFACPVPGGGIQLEWSSSKKYLEIEFLDTSTVAFLKEDFSPKGESTESGEYPLADAEATRRLLDWFAAM